MYNSNLISRGRLAGTNALRRIGAAARQARPPKIGPDDTAPVEYLYVPCARIRYRGFPAETRWVQEVPIVRKTANWIYYTSDSWDRVEAVVSPGCISRQAFEADTRCRDGCPAGVIPIPGVHPRSVGQLFFATRHAAEYHLYRGASGQTARGAARVKELRRAMADAHPDRSGTVEQFIEARRRYQTALVSARR